MSGAGVVSSMSLDRNLMVLWARSMTCAVDV